MDAEKFVEIENDEKIVPKCMQMCPATECSFRKKQNLVHILETEGNTVKQNSRNPNRMVKTYCRSAAGQNLAKSELLRPPEVLVKTVNFIFKTIINDDRVSKTVIYDFVNDRLRSIKQDGVIQRLSPEDWFKILPPIIRFYAFSAYWYIVESSNNFDQKLNKNQLRDCLLHFICNYDLRMHSEYADIYAEVEALYLIINLDVESINRAVLLDLPQDIFQDTLKLVLKYYEKNYLAVFRRLKTLHLLPACFFTAIHMRELRKNFLQIKAFAYNSKNSNYPLAKVEVSFLFNSEEEAIAECSFYGIEMNENKTIRFKKLPLKSEIAPAKKVKILDEKLAGVSVTNLLLKK